MNLSNVKSICGALLFVTTLTLTTFAHNPLDSLIQTLPEICTQQMQQRGWPSISITIVLDQKIIFSQAFGYADVERKIPATTKTIYRIGSMTKLFSATMLTQLAERGKISLDDPLVEYIPQYKPKYQVNTGPTTMRQLATHTSGLHVDAGQAFWHYLSNFQWVVTKGQENIIWGITKDDLLATLDKVEIEYTPNTYPYYSNFGYQLLGIALERVVGEPFEEYIKSNILIPLGMENSDFALNIDQKRRFAVGYTYLEPDFNRYLSPEWDLTLLKYSGGLYSTPEDIARFISLQFRDGMDSHPEIISGDRLRFMRTPQTLRNPESGDTYGLGWAIYTYKGHQIIAHAGGHWGFFAKAEVIPDLKFGVVVMTNCNYPQGSIGPDEELTRIIIDKFIPLLEKKITEKASDAENIDLEMYSGLYAIPGNYANANLSIKNDTLYFSLVEKPLFDVAILPVGSHQFCFALDPGKNPMIVFNTDELGYVVSLEFLSYRFKKKYK
jgi:CubicO group peptidase (beta-lactamase class C family)